MILTIFALVFLLMPVLEFGMLPRIQDSRNMIFKLTQQEHETLRKNCRTYEEYCQDQRVNHKQVIAFSPEKAFINHENIMRLILTLNKPGYIDSINSPQRNELLKLADYLQAPKLFMRELIKKAESQNTKKHKPDKDLTAKVLVNHYFSIGEYLREMHTRRIPIRMHWYDGMMQQLNVKPLNNCLKNHYLNQIYNLQGISNLKQHCKTDMIISLDLSGNRIENFAIGQLRAVMPHLRSLNLSNNAITHLKRCHLEGMPENFVLNIAGNPLAAIAHDCLTVDLIEHAHGSRIFYSDARNNLDLYKDLLEISRRFARWNDEAEWAVPSTHASIIILATMLQTVLTNHYMPHVSIGGQIVLNGIAASLMYILLLNQLFKNVRSEYPLRHIRFVDERNHYGEFYCYSTAFKKCFSHGFKNSLIL